MFVTERWVAGRDLKRGETILPAAGLPLMACAWLHGTWDSSGGDMYSTYKTAGQLFLAWISIGRWFEGEARSELNQRFLYHHKRCMASCSLPHAPRRGTPRD